VDAGFGATPQALEVDIDAKGVGSEVAEATDVRTQAATDIEDPRSFQRQMTPDHLQTAFLPEAPDVAWLP
jgi:hypothetical protein